MAFRLFDLNDPQREAATTTEGPLLILAGAGTGKTRVITARVAHLIHLGVHPAQILAVTFTNKAANEMRERLAGMIEPAAAKKVAMSTFHALCVRILRAHAEALGYKNNFAIYDDSDQLGLIKKIAARCSSKDEKPDAAAIKNAISKAKNAGLHAPVERSSLAGEVFARYQADLKTLNAMDFDDLLLLGVQLFNEHEDIRRKWADRYRYLMVDEFQDTNRLQLDLVALLAKRSDGAPPNVCVVGDDDQSIYGWRGAEVSNILEFEHHFPGPKIVRLEQNYRSTNAILGAANSVIKNNPRRRPKQLWSAAGDGEKVRVVQMPCDRTEASWVCDEIQRRQFAEGEPWERFAILFRMNAQAAIFEKNLRAGGIPYRMVGAKSFFDKREVKDFLAYLSVLENPDDDIALLRIINIPARGIGPSVIERATEHSIARGCSVAKAFLDGAFLSGLTAKTRAAISSFFEMLDRFETRAHEPLANLRAVAEALLAETGYLEDLRRTCKSPGETEMRENAIRDLLTDLERSQERRNGGLRGFLDAVALDRDREDEDDLEKKQGVTLITLHAAKGLEFPHVYLVGLEEGILPHDRSKMEGALDEERRLLYVGITRAMKTLHITWCGTRIRYGSPCPCHPSQFLAELDDRYVERLHHGQIRNTPMTADAMKTGFAALREALSKM